MSTTAANLFWAMEYNGREKEVERLQRDLKAFADKEDLAFMRPDYIDGDDLELFWMVLVISYGEYGTSPRYGWFDKEQAEFAAEWLWRYLGITWKHYWDEEVLNTLGAEV